MVLEPNTPSPRPDVEGMRADARHPTEQDDFANDVLVLAEYIEALEKELCCPLGFEVGSEDCSAGTCPKCLSVRLKASVEKLAALMRADNDYRISATDCTETNALAALGDGDG